MNRRFSTNAVLAGVLLISASAAYSSHRGIFEAHLIGNKIYWYSINFEELLAKIAGKDLKDQTFLNAELKIDGADGACANPQSHVIIPGTGPKVTAFSVPDQVTDNELFKKDRVQGNIYQSTTSVIDLVPAELRLNPPTNPDGTSQVCKDAPGNSSWVPLFWQDRECNKGGETKFQYTCYKDFAEKRADGTLWYVTGEFAGTQVAVGTNLDVYWTFAYLPTLFRFKIVLSVGGADIETHYGSCQFPLNPSNGKPYSITNPPANGWAGLPRVEYSCIPITSTQYGQP